MGNDEDAIHKPSINLESTDSDELIWRGRTGYQWSSLRWRILIIAFIAAVAFAAYLGFNLIQSNSQAHSLENIQDKRYPVQIKLQEAFFTLRFIQAKMEDAVITGELESLVEVRELKRDFLASISMIREIDPAIESASTEITEAFSQYYDDSYKLALDFLEGRVDFSQSAEQGARNAAHYSHVVALLENIKEEELSRFSTAVNYVTQQAKAVVTTGAPVGIFTVIVLFLLAGYTSRGIIRRVNFMVGTLRTIARDNGDMSVRIPVKGVDEMAELAFWFNAFIAKLDRITRQSTAEIKRLAYSDILTDLPNRRMFNIKLEQAVAHYRKTDGNKLAVMFLDLDNFKTINDLFGHDAGDLLIKEVALRLSRTIRGKNQMNRDVDPVDNKFEDIVARMGGDEFMIFLNNIGGSSHAASVAERVRTEILAPIELMGSKVEVGVSIGISIFPEHGSTAEKLIANADLAMYEAKASGKSNYAFFRSELEEASRFNMEIELALRRAISNDELHLVYQPKFDLKSGRLNGAEALLRWDSPEFGVISPARFLPLAETSDLICSIDLWVMKSAFEQVVSWKSQGLSTVPIAINVSARQAAKPDLVQRVDATLKSLELQGCEFEFEVTETSALSNMEMVANNIRGLKKLGSTVALDDFGAGHSSLTLLKYCDIDVLKIDRGFMTELHSVSGKPIIEAVVALAKVLRIRTVAEGVEEEQELLTVKKMGCDYAQGYFLSRPLSPNDLARMLPEINPRLQIGNI